MTKLFNVSLLVALGLLATTSSAYAVVDDEQEEVHGAEEAHGEFDPIHHSADGYYLDFEPFGEVHLPRFFFVRRGDGGLGFDAYASTESALHSGRTA